MNKKIAAIVITFNRIEFLKDLINALRHQTRKLDAIIVLNNNSSDGTKEWLENQSDLIVIHQDNVGSSGGQYTGFKYAFEQDYDYIWTMDDDVEPVETCLENLLVNINENRIHAPLRFQPDGKVFFNEAVAYNLTNPFKSFWNGIITEKDINQDEIPVTGLTFEGPILPRQIIEKIGFPDKKFFIYGDDTEYMLRAKKFGAETFLIKKARLNRKLNPVDKLQDYGWKYYYAVRNLIAINVLHGNLLVRLIRPIIYLLLYSLKSKSLSLFKQTLIAFKDGYFYKQ